MQTDCPNKFFVNLTEEVLFLEDSVKEDDSSIYDAYNDDDECVTWSHNREAIVIQRSMNTMRVENNDWLRNTIFHTRCTANGRICNVIINGRSCENIVSQEMVDKLKLKAEKGHTSDN